VAEGVLPPAIQEFIADATEWVAGIDEMVEANERLLASIEEVQAAAREAGMAADEAAGAEAGAGAGAEAGAGAGAESADAAAAAADASAAAADSADDLASAQADAARTAQAEAAAQAEVADSAASAAGPVAALRDATAGAGEAFSLAGEQGELFSRDEVLLAQSAGLVAEAMEAQARAAGINAEVLVYSLGEMSGAIAAAAEQSGLYVDAMGRMRQANGAVVSSVAAVRDALAEEGDTSGMTAEELRLLSAATELAAETDAQLAAGAALITDALGIEARAAGLNADAQKSLAASSAEAGEASSAAAGKFKMFALAALIGVAASVKMAGDFQQSMTRLVTSAGESEKNISLVSRGIIQLSVSTNTSAKNLAAGMYYVESAGFHGAAALAVLKSAAQGAQAEGADMVTVSDALTTALDDYGMTSVHAAVQQHYANVMMNEMITAVSRGKMTLQDFAGSLSTLLPVAHQAGLSFAQVAGAEATMTAQGMSARQASQDLRHVIMSLRNPTSVQSTEMGQLGINSTKLALAVGRVGLTGTLDELSRAILRNMGPGGEVLLKAFNQSQLAAQSAKTMIASMPPSIQGVAEAYQRGSITAQQWNHLMFEGSIPAKYKNLLEQFAAVSNKANGFNDVLKAGGGNVQTYTAAMEKMTGGITGVQVASMLGGKNALIFSNNVKAIGDSAKNTGSNVQNWALIQKNFNFQLGSAEKSVQAVAISLGSDLLPAVSKVMRWVTEFAQMIARNAIACKGLAIVIGSVLAVALERNLAKGVLGAGKALRNLGGDVKGVIGWFRAGSGEVSLFGRVLNGFAQVGQAAWGALQSAWSGLTGLFGRARDAVMAMTGAEDAQAASASAAAEAEGAAAAAAEAEAGALDEAAAASEVAAAAAGELDVALDANPIGAIIVLILALVAIFVELWRHCAGFRDFWKAAWRDIKGAFIDGWHAIDDVIHAIESAFDWVRAEAQKALDWIRDHWKTLAEILGGPVGAATVYITDHWKQVKETFEDAYNWVKAHWPLLTAILVGPIGLAIGYIVRHWRDFEGVLGAIFDAIKQSTLLMWRVLYDAVFRPMGDAIRIQMRMWGDLAGQAGRAWAAIREVTVGSWHLIDSAVFRPLGDAIGIQMRMWGDLADAVGHACTDIWHWLEDTEEMAYRIFTAIGEDAEQFADRVADDFSRMIQAVTSRFGWLISDVEHIGGEIVSYVASLGGELFSAGAHIIESLASGIESAAGSVLGAMSHVLTLGIGNLIPKSPAKAGPLSGEGDPQVGGQKIVQRLAAGILSDAALPAAALTAALRGLGFAADSRLALSGALSAPAPGAAAGPGAVPSVNVRVDLANALSSPQWQQGLQRVIQQAILDYALRNSGSGLILPQRTR
jgi:Phage-related minor tail protein